MHLIFILAEALTSADTRNTPQSRPQSGTTCSVLDSVCALPPQTTGPRRSADTRWPTPAKPLPLAGCPVPDARLAHLLPVCLLSTICGLIAAAPRLGFSEPATPTVGCVAGGRKNL